MVELQFYSDINFSNFVDDTQIQLGSVDAQVDVERRVMRLSSGEFARHQSELHELVRDYGGRVVHARLTNE